MKSSLKALLGVAAAAALVGAAGVSAAQEGPRQGERPRIEGRGPGPGGEARASRDPKAMAEHRAQMMRNRLGLRADQEAAFQAFLQATRPPADRAARQAQMKEMQSLTTPQRLDRQMEEMRRRADATKRFYAALTPEQRKSFDTMPRGGHGEMRRRGPGGPGGHGTRGTGPEGARPQAPQPR